MKKKYFDNNYYNKLNERMNKAKEKLDLLNKMPISKTRKQITIEKFQQWINDFEKTEEQMPIPFNKKPVKYKPTPTELYLMEKYN